MSRKLLFRGSRAAYVYSKIIEVVETVSPKYTVVPITLNLHYSIAWMGPYRLDFFLGVGLSRTRLNYEYIQAATFSGYTGKDVYTFSADKNGFGAEGGAAFEWVISPRFSVRLNVTGRLASLTDFVGTWTEKGEGDFWNGETGGSAGRELL